MSAIEIPSPEIKCPTCGGPTAHRNEGIHWCKMEGCRGFVLTEIGARVLHEALCRKSGMTADEIVVYWNEKSPEDLW